MSKQFTSFSFDEVEASEMEASTDEKATPKNDTTKLAEAFEESSQSDEEPDLGNDLNTAFALLETDEFIMTDKGVISKSIVQDNSNASKKNENPKDDKILGKFKDVDDLIKSYTELEKKLGSNSEAVNKLREVEPVLPMLEAMINDEGFLDMAERYFTNPEEQRKALMKSLDLEDGFQFDLENALADPTSKDAKVLEKIANRRNAKQAPKQTSENSKPGISEDEKKAFVSKYGITDDDFDGMIEQSKNYKITLDDIYYLINKDKIIENAKKEASKPFKEQSNAARTIGRSSQNGGGVPQTTKEDVFMQFLTSSSDASIFS
jgi:hypothetical protein